MELLCGKGEGKEKLSGSETAVRATGETERDTLSVADEETSRESEKKREKFTAAPPIKVMEPKTVSATGTVCTIMYNIPLVLNYI